MHRNSNKHNELGWNETGGSGRVVGSWYGCAPSSALTVGGTVWAGGPPCRVAASEIRPSTVRSLTGHFFHGATTGQTPEPGGGAPSNRSCRGRFCPALLLPGGLFASSRLVSMERRMCLGHGGESPSGAKMNWMEIVSVLYHFAPWRKNLRNGRKQHSALGLRRASRSARERGPGQQPSRPLGRADLVAEIAQESVRLKPDLRVGLSLGVWLSIAGCPAFI